VIESMSSFSLHPTPSVSVEAGLTLRGYGYLSDSMWPTMSHECPLTKRAHDALCWMQGASIARQKGDFERMQYCERIANTRRGALEISRNTHFEAARQRYAQIGVVPALGLMSGTNLMNPLDL
jgi:hypothetical protein